MTDHERRNLNNPTVAWRKWMAATRVKKPKSRTAAVSATEHGRAQAMINEQQARIAELEEELTGARGADDYAALLDDACKALTACFRSLGSDMNDVKDLLPARLFAYWHRHKAE